jgi:hypothetical protein
LLVDEVEAACGQLGEESIHEPDTDPNRHWKPPKVEIQVVIVAGQVLRDLGEDGLQASSVGLDRSLGVTQPVERQPITRKKAAAALPKQAATAPQKIDQRTIGTGSPGAGDPLGA